jgi:hypothetical protein
MSNVIGFPITHVISPSLVDPPTANEHHRIMLGLEHEIAEQREVIASQAITITRYRKVHFNRGLHKSTRRTICVVSLSILALTLGWRLNFPLARSIFVQAQARIVPD